MINTIMLSIHAWVNNTIGYAINKVKEERGQDILEYAVLAGAIALVAGFVLWGATDGWFETFASKIEKCVTFDDTCGD